MKALYRKVQHRYRILNLRKNEQKEQMRVHEEDIIRGLIEAAGYTQDETKRIEIARGR